MLIQKTRSQIEFRSTGRRPLWSVVLFLALIGEPAGAQDPPSSLESALLARLDRAPLEDPIPLGAGVLRFETANERSVQKIVLQVPVSELEKQEQAEGGTYSVECAFFARVFDSQGKRVAKFIRLVPRKRPLKELKSEGAISLRQVFETRLPPGSYRLESVVQDQSSGKAGTKKLEFDVPPDREGVGLSSLVLLKRTEPVPLGSLDPTDGLQLHGKQIIPDFSGVVRKRKGGRVRLYMVIYPRQEVPYDPQLGIEFSRDGGIVGATQPRLPARDDRGNIAFIIEFSTNQFRPGDYVVRAVVRQGNSEAESSLPFRVVRE